MAEQPIIIQPENYAELMEQLTRPFAAEDIEKLPKTMKRDDQDKGTCATGTKYSADGYACGKYHARALHLDYVGHAGITMRLNDILGANGWTFEPYAITPEGLPSINQSVFYGKLTILGVTKWDMAANFNGPQEAYGDCLRRCAMRFGIGTYLWSKSDAAASLAAATDHVPPPTPGEKLEADLDTLAERVREMVREQWPFWGRDPKDLTDVEIEEVRLLVRTILSTTIEGQK